MLVMTNNSQINFSDFEGFSIALQASGGLVDAVESDAQATGAYVAIDTIVANCKLESKEKSFAEFLGITKACRVR